jgi:hypothetical protein
VELGPCVLSGGDIAESGSEAAVVVVGGVVRTMRSAARLRIGTASSAPDTACLLLLILPEEGADTDRPGGEEEEEV